MAREREQAPLIYLIAGEPSGDLLGGTGCADVTGGEAKLRRERRPVYRLPQNRDPSRGSLSGCRGDLLRA